MINLLRKGLVDCAPNWKNKTTQNIYFLLSSANSAVVSELTFGTVHALHSISSHQVIHIYDLVNYISIYAYLFRWIIVFSFPAFARLFQRWSFPVLAFQLWQRHFPVQLICSRVSSREGKTKNRKSICLTLCKIFTLATLQRPVVQFCTFPMKSCNTDLRRKKSLNEW